ncbi:EIN3-binding F-box protein 1-like [Wolffia australiana]
MQSLVYRSVVEQEDDVVVSRRRKLSDLADAGIFLSLAPRVDWLLPPLKRTRVSAPFIPLAWENLNRCPSLDSLKDECLVEILSRLDGDKERSVAACVSKRWLWLLANRVDRASPKKPLLDLNVEAGPGDKEDQITVRCVEGDEATDLKLFAMAVGSKGGIGKLSIRSGGAAVSDLGLAAVARHSPNLRALSLWNADNVTDKGLSQIANRCPLLEKLDLFGCPSISDKGISAVAMKCCRLSSLAIESCPAVGDDCLWAVGHFCANLASVSIVDSAMVGDKGVASLLSFPSSSLRRLVLRRLAITDLSAAVVGRYGKTVAELILADLPNVSERGLWTMGCAGGLRRLESLTLAGSWATDLALEAVARGCPSLKRLSLRSADRLTDHGLRRLAGWSPSLESLQLEDCALVALISLGESLRSLSVVRCRGFRDVASSAKLRSSCPLISLTINDCPGFGDAGLVLLGKLCKRVQRLKLVSLPGISDAGLLSFFEDCRETVSLLKKVNLSGCASVTDAAIRALAELHGRSLRVLSLGDCKRITDDGLAAISESCVRLEDVDLSGCAVSDAGVAALATSAAGRDSLGVVSLSGCGGVSGRSLLHLGNLCPRLRGLNLQFCLSVTDQDVASFQNGTGRCDVLF